MPNLTAFGPLRRPDPLQNAKTGAGPFAFRKGSAPLAKPGSLD